MSYTAKKLYTDNPFIDSLLFCVKTLAYGCVIKNQDEANNNETTDSLKNSDIYISCVEGKTIFELFSYTKTELQSVGITDTTLLTKYINNKDLIPDQYRDKLTTIATADFITNYEEENEYYRKICGLPAVGDYGIPIRDYEYLITSDSGIDVTYVHELTSAQAQVLENDGILDKIKDDYPSADYLNYIGDGITFYSARKAYDFQLLYTPSTDYTDIDDLFTSTYNNNRIFVTQTMYSDAFEVKSTYYNGFIAMLILLMTMIDMLATVQDHIIRKDILDSRCIEYIFNMYGLTYYTSIPLKYQSRLCKNVNDLIKYKSCEQEMTNIIDLFSGTDIDVFKYFLLRDRNVDDWGDYVYNSETDISSNNNDIVMHTTSTVAITNNTIPFPFDLFIQKGNILIVWLDGQKLTEGTDYKILNENQIEFLNDISSGKTNIRYDFYYDKNTITEDYTADSMDAISTITSSTIPTSNNVSFSLPYSDYFNDGNQLIVVIGSTFLNPNAYTIDLTSQTIDINRSYTVSGRVVTFIYVYGKTLTTRFTKANVTATMNNQKTFTIPEPFTNYISNNNSFFINIGATYIDSRRYTVSGSTLTLTDLILNPGQNVTFNFLYAISSVYTPINIVEKVQTITATTNWQTSFTLTYPFDGYLSFGYKIYIKLRGWYVDTQYFEIFNNTILLRDNAIGLQIGEQIEIHYVYGPSSDNVGCYNSYVTAISSNQTTFTMPSYPVDNYFDNGNKIIVDAAGVYMVEGTDYHYSTDKSQLIIDNANYSLYLNQKLNLIYIYNTQSEYSLQIEQEVMIANSDGQTTFNLTLPFYPYFETSQSILVIYKSLLIESSSFTTSGETITLNNISTVKSGDSLVVLYIFNSKYLKEKASVLTKVVTTVPMAYTTDDELYATIPLPFSDYIENSWPLFIDYNGAYVNPSTYEIINNSLMFNTPTDIINYSSLTYTFIYKNNSSYINTVTSEDLDADISLKFIGVPMSDSTFSNYFKNRSHQKSYEIMTSLDEFWNGENADTNGMKTYFKNKILALEFNYARTKYMTIDYITSLSDLSFEIPYFYNLLYNNSSYTDDLTITIPTISESTKFKLAYVFMYMTVLSYIYSGVDDTILDTPTKVLYVKGFNFSQNLNDLKAWVLKQRRSLTDFNVWTFSTPSGEIESFDDFKAIYTTDKSVYATIIAGMYNANNYDIYSIWKKLYDSLMTYQFNNDFFKLSDGSVASTFTDFLEEKAPSLYTDIVRIRAITDSETKENDIVTMISDIVYIIEKYIGTDTFKYIYMQFPGVSGEYLLEYIYTMINFFKSYKINFIGINKLLNLETDTQYNFIRPIDITATNASFIKYDYIKPYMNFTNKMTTTKTDSIGFYERYMFNYIEEITIDGDLTVQ